MTNFSNENGNIVIAKEVISQVAGTSTLECYGVVGMASKNRIKDGVIEMLKKDNASKGIVVRYENDGIHIDIHIVVMYGIKIKEVASNVQTKVAFDLNAFGIEVNSVHVYVEDVVIKD